MVFSSTSPRTVSGAGTASPAKFAQATSGWFGSASTTATLTPASARPVERRSAAVVLPTPPLELTSETTGMRGPFRNQAHRQRIANASNVRGFLNKLLSKAKRERDVSLCKHKAYVS